VKNALERHRAALSNKLCGALAPIATAMAANPLMDDRMAVNMAVLLNRINAGLLEGVLNRLDTETGGKLTFRSIGPLPPASFATVEVNFPQPHGACLQALELGRWLAPAISCPLFNAWSVCTILAQTQRSRPILASHAGARGGLSLPDVSGRGVWRMHRGCRFQRWGRQGDYQCGPQRDDASGIRGAGACGIKKGRPFWGRPSISLCK
jgi:hypothetical protein